MIVFLIENDHVHAIEDAEVEERKNFYEACNPKIQKFVLLIYFSKELAYIDSTASKILANFEVRF